MSLWVLASYALVLWWGGTALVWLLVQRGEQPRHSLWLLPLVGGVSLGIVHGASMIASVPASILGFTGALMLWGALEAAHLYGWLTGPEKAPCPAHISGFERFRRGINVGLHHDLGILLAIALLWLLAYGAVNPTAAWTFTVLWLMRWSAKLNLFLGVANFDPGLMPQRMRYMATYMQRKPINLLYPVSILLGLLIVLYGVHSVRQGLLAPHLAAGVVLTTSLAVLGLIEHILMMIPVRDSQLWRWAAAHSSDS